MSAVERNLELISKIPEEYQGQILAFLINFCSNTPFKPLSENDIIECLEKSRTEYESGNYEDFDTVLNNLEATYAI